MSGWHLICFAPEDDHLARAKQLTQFTGLRVQVSRSKIPDATRTAMSVLRRVRASYEHVMWGPMDGPDDYEGLEGFVRAVLGGLAPPDRPTSVVFDAELKDPDFAKQDPTPQHAYNEHVLPAIHVAQRRGIPTLGPGTTHTRGEDEIGFEVLNQLQVNGLGSIHTPSLHWYPADKGWHHAEARLRATEARLRSMGWEQGAITETGAHGAWLRSVDGWGCGVDRSPSETRQRDRVEEIRSRLDSLGFWVHSCLYQIDESWLDEPHRRFGFWDSDQERKLVADLFS